MTNSNKNLGKILRWQRRKMLLTLGGLSAKSGVSASHLARVERGDRFPSAQILRKIAKVLDFSEVKLLTTAGYLSPQSPSIVESSSERRLDPYVAAVLSQEPLEIQRTVVTLLSVLKSMAEYLRTRTPPSLDKGRGSGG